MTIVINDIFKIEEVSQVLEEYSKAGNKNSLIIICSYQDDKYTDIKNYFKTNEIFNIKIFDKDNLRYSFNNYIYFKAISHRTFDNGDSIDIIIEE